jgi:hypothetical protein
VRALGRLGGPHHGGGVGHVDGAARDGLADIGRRLVGKVAVEIPDLDRRAARREALGDGLANSLSPAGDDGDMPVQVDLVHEALQAERFTVN